MPEADTWALELRKTLTGITAGYQRLRDVAETGVDKDGSLYDPLQARIAATTAATEALVQIVLALDNLSDLKGAFRNGPITDLIGALEDLRRGRSPELLKPSPQMTGQSSTQLSMLKVRAVASVFIFERSGASNIQARNLVAKIFADAGHRGKKGSPISASTLFKWGTDFEDGADDTAEKRIVLHVLGKLPDAVSRSEAVRLAKIEAGKRL